MYIVDQRLGNFTKIDSEVFFTVHESHKDWVYRFPENIQIDWMCSTFGNPGAVALDIGAHCGTWSVCLAKKFGSVISFEPNPRVFNNLCANLALKDLSNVTPVRQCLSGSKKIVNYYHRSTDGGGNGIEPLNNTIDSGCTTMSVQTTSLDHWIGKAKNFGADQKIAFIKIDVEGHEIDVLRGAVKTIAAHRPAIVVESWEAWRESEGIPAVRLRNELFEYIHGLRYAIRPVNGHSEMFLCTPE